MASRSSTVTGEMSDEMLMTGDVQELDAAGRDADRVVLCRCGGFGRVHHKPVDRPGETEAYVRSGFTCTWDRSGPHGPLIPLRGDTQGG